jgi:hypothetical protein
MSDLARERAIELEDEVFRLNREIERLQALARQLAYYADGHTLQEPHATELRKLKQEALGQ